MEREGEILTPEKEYISPVWEYNCTKCKAHWVKGKKSSGKSEQCKKCSSTVTPRQVERSGLTPYQGPNRCYGKYRCACSRMWMSGNSWANIYQRCKSCNKGVYPHVQKSLKKPDGLDKSNPKRRHAEDLCQKCKRLGHSCVPARHHDVYSSDDIDDSDE